MTPAPGEATYESWLRRTIRATYLDWRRAGEADMPEGLIENIARAIAAANAPTEARPGEATAQARALVDQYMLGDHTFDEVVAAVAAALQTREDARVEAVAHFQGMQARALDAEAEVAELREALRHAHVEDCYCYGSEHTDERCTEFRVRALAERPQ